MVSRCHRHKQPGCCVWKRNWQKMAEIYQGVIHEIDPHKRLPDGHMDQHTGGLETPGTQRGAQKVTHKVRKSPGQRKSLRGCGASVLIQEKIGHSSSNLKLIWWLPTIIALPFINFLPSCLLEPILKTDCPKQRMWIPLRKHESAKSFWVNERCATRAQDSFSF